MFNKVEVRIKIENEAEVIEETMHKSKPAAKSY